MSLSRHPKRFVNSSDSVVQESLDGFLAQNRRFLTRLSGYPHTKVILRRDWNPKTSGKSQVALISGGGAGHEPAHAGFVGKGLLTAAVSGEIFASPQVDAILSGIIAVTGEAGCLVIVKNYTGDRLNFGLACERAKAEYGLKVRLLIVADDIALSDSGKSKINSTNGSSPDHGVEQSSVSSARGLAGTLLVHKVAGAAAARGLSLDDVHRLAQSMSNKVKTLGVSLSTCTQPFSMDGRSLGDNVMEVGLGIHGEPGARKRHVGKTNEICAEVVREVIIKALEARHGWERGILDAEQFLENIVGPINAQMTMSSSNSLSTGNLNQYFDEIMSQQDSSTVGDGGCGLGSMFGAQSLSAQELLKAQAEAVTPEVVSECTPDCKNIDQQNIINIIPGPGADSSSALSPGEIQEIAVTGMQTPTKNQNSETAKNQSSDPPIIQIFPKPKRDTLLLFLNNLGSVPPMEMTLITKSVLEALQLHFFPALAGKRIFLLGGAQLMTSLDMNGFSLSAAVISSELYDLLESESSTAVLLSENVAWPRAGLCEVSVPRPIWERQQEKFLAEKEAKEGGDKVTPSGNINSVDDPTNMEQIDIAAATEQTISDPLSSPNSNGVSQKLNPIPPLDSVSYLTVPPPIPNPLDTIPKTNRTGGEVRQSLPSPTSNFGGGGAWGAISSLFGASSSYNNGQNDDSLDLLNDSTSLAFDGAPRSPDLDRLVHAVCQALMLSKDELNALDSRCGDGDTGTQLSLGAQAVLEAAPSSGNVGELCCGLSRILGKSMGGSSGALLSILFASMGADFYKREGGFWDGEVEKMKEMLQKKREAIVAKKKNLKKDVTVVQSESVPTQEAVKLSESDTGTKEESDGAAVSGTSQTEANETDDTATDLNTVKDPETSAIVDSEDKSKDLTSESVDPNTVSKDTNEEELELLLSYTPSPIPLPSVSSTIQALQTAIQSVQYYGGARKGDRTFLDALIPVAESASSLEEAYVLAQRGSEKTKLMKAGLGIGRTAYIEDSSEYEGVADPGAAAVAVALRAMQEASFVEQWALRAMQEASFEEHH